MKFDGVNNMRVLIERSSAHFIIGALLSTDPLSLSPAHAEKKIIRMKLKFKKVFKNINMFKLKA